MLNQLYEGRTQVPVPMVLAVLAPLATELPERTLALTGQQAEVRQGTWYVSQRAGQLSFSFGEFFTAAERAEVRKRDQQDPPEDLQHFSFTATCNLAAGSFHLDQDARLQTGGAWTTLMACPDSAKERDGQLLREIILSSPQLRTDAEGNLYLVAAAGVVQLQREKPAEVATSVEWLAT